MAHQLSTSAQATRRQGIALAISLIVCAGPAGGAEAPQRSSGKDSRALGRVATSYCAYEVGSRLVAEAINNRNQIVGTAELDGDLAQAFVWDRRGIRLLGVTPGALISIGKDINDRGQVVGISGGPFIWTRSRGIQVFPTLGGGSVSVTHINNVGQVIGLSTTVAEDNEHLYLRERNGDVLDLGIAKIPFGLNDAGQVGFSVQSDQPPPTSDVFIWDPDTGERRLRGFPPDRLILPGAINDRRHIVGSVLRDDQFPHAMRWTSQKGMEELTAPDEAGFSHATDVNESGTVVGYMEQGFMIGSFVWQERTGLRDLSRLLDPTSPSIPQAEAIEARALNNNGWIVVNTGPRGGPYMRPYVLTPKFRGDRTSCSPEPPF